MRPANILTAITDIMAGIAIAGFLAHGLTDVQAVLQVTCLAIATIGLYGGGVVFNDIFDASLDRIERPERPIPSGIISKTEAVVLGVYLLLLGVLAAFTVGELSGFIAIGIAVAALVYNKWGKHHKVLGPFNMGLCRGLNLLLGISIVPASLPHYGWLAVVPVLYIASITMISRDEVHGGKKRTLVMAAIGYAIVCALILWQGFMKGEALKVGFYLVILLYLILTPLFKAMKEPTGPNIGKAVKGGIIGLIVMNAAWVAAFAIFPYPLAVLAFLPLSMLLSKAFAVT
ncbi:polyprenyltransferase [Chitinophaga barathri]|uniref:Polyprenyltransferase n=2 Tax=Chitinophaga barathri TaxID=1647451 RepID=A0A3N4M7M0_9BACT|nr:polyprenyltransferase [Chitinophaga barathri]